MSDAAAPEPTPAPPRRRRRRAAAIGLALLSAPPLAFLGLVRVHHAPEPALAPWEGALPAAVDPQAAPAAGADADGDGLDDALEAALARRFAPRYRFTARDPAGPASAQNRDERFFPMSVARFLAGLEAGLWEVAERGRVRAEGPGRFEDARVLGFPSRLVGDPVGQAPVYTHVYPSEVAGEAFCEYWVFYGYDRAEARVLGALVPLGDHRGDWEHTAYRVALDPPRLLEGYYYGHARCLLVPREDLERVEGEHPVVYVSQGKHAAYPAPCVLDSVPLPAWLVQHHDVANGRGPVWDAWRGPVIDLGERGRPSAAAADWLAFAGRWGPDGVAIGPLEIGTSPTGPCMKWSWGANGAGVPWREGLAGQGGRLLPPVGAR